jgi:hypothetical protein
MPKAFRVLSTKEAASDEVRVGDVVYELMDSDLGLSWEDELGRGYPHRSVTFKNDGDYPFFTIPEKDLEEI